MSTRTTAHDVEVSLLSRREFLYYLGGMSAALFAAGTCGLLYQYVTRNVPLEQQQGVINVNPDLLHLDLSPAFVREAATYLSRSDGGVIALVRACVFDETGVIWVWLNNRYECPRCGSKYRLDGTYIEGPATRGLDRFRVWVKTSEGRLSASEGQPISVDDAVQVFIDTRTIFPGQPRS